jgi:hypothetical protein
MKLNPNIIRQGDVIAVYRESIPEDAPVAEPGQRVILAHGEVTGHTHALKSEVAPSVAPSTPVFDASAERYMLLLDDRVLGHEEHTIAKFKKGGIELGVQVEAGPGNMLRRVVD